jgi:hypothetical protein
VTRKIINAIISIMVLVVLLSGCGQTMASYSTSLPPVTQTSSPLTASASTFPASVVSTSASSTPGAIPTPDDSGRFVQAELPLTINQPVDGSNLNTATITVKGQTVPGASVSVNDQVSTADKTGNFNITLNTVDGPNFLEIIAADNRGNREEITMMVYVDLSQVLTTSASTVSSGSAASPMSDIIALKVVTPDDGATLNTGRITVKGQTAPGAIVSVNDQVGTADEQGNFSIAIILDSGVNLIEVSAIDSSGNQAEVILIVNVT